MRDSNDKKETYGVVSTFLAIEQSLKNYLMRFLIGQQDIEDTVQETFLRAFEAQKTTEIRSPKSFMFKIAKNIALSELSRKTNKMKMAIGDFEELEVLETSTTLEDDLETGRILEFLIEAVRDLPPRCQTAFVMRKVYGFSHKEIANRLNISVKTVEKHLTKGLQRCQSVMAEFDNEEGRNSDGCKKYDESTFSVAVRDE